MRTRFSFDNRTFLTVIADEHSPNDIQVEAGDHTFAVAVRQNDNGDWMTDISQDGWAWDGNNLDYPTADDAMNAALGAIADAVSETDN